jgi:hypothetical protein
MWRWFSRITTREKALASIRNVSALLVVFAIIDAAIAAALMFAHSPYLHYSANDLLGLMLSAGIIVLLAGTLRGLNSRIAATLLLLFFIATFLAMAAAGAGKGAPSGNLFLVVVEIGISIRAMQATFALHGRLAEQSVSPDLEPTTATTPPPRASPPPPPPPKPYDVEKWETLVKYDDDIAMVVQKLGPLGQKWIDELARSYLAINDKKYLLPIVQKIIRAARDEGKII